MRWTEQITLIALAEPPEATNEHGFDVPKSETATTVWADKKSVGYNEFYKANMAGIAAEMKFDVHAIDYAGQMIAEYPVGSGKRYRIYRTYDPTKDELIELTLSDTPAAQDAPEEAEGGDDDGTI